MSELHKALGDITSIRRQVATSTEFRGYGPATLAVTSAFAAVAALLQHRWLPVPAAQIHAYAILWITTAVLSAGLAAFSMISRSRRIHSGISDEMLAMAVQQLLPSLASGLLVTLVLVGTAPHVAWMLPGLWQIFYSLGIFASCRFLPRTMFVAGAWYLASGLACLSLADARALSPFAMALPFAIGQLVIAAVLYFGAAGDADEL